MIGIGALVAHASLSRRNPWFLGALVPTLYVALAIALDVAEPARSGGVVIIGQIGLLGVLLLTWWAGADARAARRGGSDDAAGHPGEAGH